MDENPAPHVPDDDEVLRLLKDATEDIRRSRKDRDADRSPQEAPHGPAPEPEAQPAWDQLQTPHSASQSEPERALAFLPAQEFMEADFPEVDALIGSPEDTLLCAGSTLMVYGKGGAGKTTLTIDLMCHLAAGIPWLGQTVAAPCRIILIENEGPLVNLQARLLAKRDGWEGEPWWPNVDILFSPWHGFSFRNDQHRQDLADRITWFEAALVIVGPLITIGAMGAGTPQDVADFELLIEDVRTRTVHDPAFLLVHHENKSGGISGAWDRWPDSVLHLKAQDKGRTHLDVEKARWSTQQGESMNLLWASNYGYAIEQKQDRPSDEDVETRIHQLYDTDDRWRILDEVMGAIHAGKKPTQDALQRLTDSGYLTYQKGPPGRSPKAKCWCHDIEQAAYAPDSPPDTRTKPEESGESGEDDRGSYVEDNPTGPWGGDVVPPRPESGGLEPATDPNSDIPW